MNRGFSGNLESANEFQIPLGSGHVRDRVLLSWGLSFAIWVGVFGLSFVKAEEPLPAKIDRLIAAKLGNVSVAKRSSDAEFARRIHLDLIGRIPTRTEIRQFLADASPDKRNELIDRLLESPEYPRHMREQFHVLLMERRGDDPEWAKFLRTSFETNASWSAMVQAMLHAPIEEETQRGAAYFLTARLTKEGAMAEVDVPGLTRDVGRLFAGVDWQCCQCHDHLTIDHYKQKDFQGLNLFFTNITPRTDLKFPAIGEKLLTQKQDFMSVFDQIAMQTGPVVPGRSELEIPAFAKGEEYQEPPDRKTRSPGIPKFSPLAKLAEELPAPDNELFRRHSANLTWFVMMGHGLVHPLDLQHPDNPPSHPELLELLAKEWAANKFDFKWMWRNLARTEAYQRSSTLPAGEPALPLELFAVMREKHLTAESLFWSVLTATGELERFQSQEKYQAKTAEQIVAEVKELKTLEDLFIKTFANPPQEPEYEFAPTVKAALFVLNDKRVLGLFERQDGNLIDRLAKLSDDQVAQELFLSILSREPTPDDSETVTAYLKVNSDRRDIALGHLAWALVSSTEFCVNH
jgi:Protein of unknown function (DUF1549)/Protein of unknown function (DUF1553)